MAAVILTCDERRRLAIVKHVSRKQILFILNCVLAKKVILESSNLKPE